MGLLKAWKGLKATAAAGTADGRTPHGVQGVLMGVMGSMLEMWAPMFMLLNPERGAPLPGSDPDVPGPATADGLADGIAAIHARDSAFDPAALVTFADQVYAAVAHCAAVKDASAARPVMTDTLWNPLAAAVGLAMAPVPWQRILASGRATGTLVAAHSGTWYDSALIRFDTHLELPPGMEPRKGDRQLATQWPEEWLFQRSHRPGGDPTMAPETCPSCGAPTSVDEHGACTHCRNGVPLLTAGWLVSRILSENPEVLHERDQMFDNLRSSPQVVQMLPDSLRRLLPPDILAAAAAAPTSSHSGR